MHSGGNVCCISAKHPAYPFSVGIASIILEGRSSDDEEENHVNQKLQNSNSNADHFMELSKKKNFLHDTAQRINQKLQQIRACPGTSKDIIGIESIPSSSRDYENYSNAHFKYGGTGSGNGCGSNSNGNEETSGSAASDQAKNGIKSSYNFNTSKSFLKTVGAWAETNIVNMNGFDKNKMFNMNQSIIKNKATVTSPTMCKKKAEKLGPRQGPHCQQFMKEIGLVKIDADDIDHNCHYDNKHVSIEVLCKVCLLLVTLTNIIFCIFYFLQCIHWQSYFKQLSSILSDNESICIEVYLGPEYYAILLEQWILTLTDK